jgi:hypothetical protein
MRRLSTTTRLVLALGAVALCWYAGYASLRAIVSLLDSVLVR